MIAKEYIKKYLFLPDDEKDSSELTLSLEKIAALMENYKEEYSYKSSIDLLNSRNKVYGPAYNPPKIKEFTMYEEPYIPSETSSNTTITRGTPPEGFIVKLNGKEITSQSTDITMPLPDDTNINYTN